MRLHAVKLGLAGGILWGLALFIFAWVSKYTGWGLFWFSQWIDLYPGMDLSVVGIFMTLGYGFITGFVSLFLLAWIYNLLRP